MHRVHKSNRLFCSWPGVAVVLTLSVSTFGAAHAGGPVLLEGGPGPDSFGSALASAGDVNGDGYGDLVVGAPGHDGAAGLDCGKVYLFLGSPEGVDAEPAWSHEGHNARVLFGSSVAGPGDVDGDGYDDVVVGAPNDPGGGAVFLFRGSREGLSDEPDWSHASGRGGSFGLSAASAGDVDGDGYPDFAVGSRSLQEVWVYAGGADGPGDGPDWVLDGGPIRIPWWPPLYGRYLAGGGDVNADGYADLAVAAPMDSEGTPLGGKASTYHGGPDGVGGDPEWTFLPDQHEENLGRSVATGDVDGDGFADALVGAPWFDHERNADCGRLMIFRGSPLGLGDDPAWTRVGDRGTGLGRWATLADVDGDGYDDVVATARGQLVIEFGSPDGPVAPPDEGRIPLPVPYPHLNDVAAVGDLDGDGAEDIAGWVYEPGVIGPGKVLVIPGVRFRPLDGREDGDD